MAPLLVFCAALVPRLIGLGSQSFWLDEAFTLVRARLPFAALVRDALQAHHSPLYFLLVAPFASLRPVAFWLRLPSAVSGAAAVALVYLIGARAAGRRAGLCAAFIAAVSPAQLAFSQEARSYMPVMCLVLLAQYGVLGFAKAPERAAIAWWRAGAARADWAMFTLGTCGALALLGDALPWAITGNVIVLGLVRGNRLGLLRNLLLFDIAGFAVATPIYAPIVSQKLPSLIESVTWIPPLTFHCAWFNFGWIYLMKIGTVAGLAFPSVATPVVLQGAVAAGMAAAAALGAARLWRRPRLLWAVGLCWAALPIMAIAIAASWRSILLPRYILWSGGGYAVLAGTGAAAMLARLTPRWRPPAAAMAALLLVMNLLPYYRTETKPRWDLAARILAREAAPGDALVASFSSSFMLSPYIAPALVPMLYRRGDDAAFALAAHAGRRRVWAVNGEVGQIDMNVSQATFQAMLAPLGRPAAVFKAGRQVVLERFDP